MNKAEQIQTEFYKRLTGQQRLKIASELHTLSLKVMEAGLRERYPKWSKKQIRLAQIQQFLPHDLFQEAYLKDP